MKPITFCIPTAKNEKEYIRLLLNSLKDHTNIDLHEVLVFVDTDNQNTYEMLLDYKEQIPNLRIHRNTKPCQVGGQRNITLMFNEAKSDIVCYLQSDMIVGKDFDKHIHNSLVSEDIVLACARIEPPLHPPSPEKIVKDFGITPELFDYEAFNSFVSELQAEQRPDVDGHFAPFAVYKRTWIDKLGGFDTQFRCSREDSDSMIRMDLWNLKRIQSWNACVYHFTCVSSRGDNWFAKTSEADYKNELQTLADTQELKRFIRKWGFFGHHPRPVYDISFNIDADRYVDLNLLKAIEPYCSRMYISDANVAKELASQLEFESDYYTNLRWNYPDEYWKKIKYLFNPTDFSSRITCADNKVGDVVVDMKYSDILKNWNDAIILIQDIQKAVDQNEVGSYDGGFCTIHIHEKRNLVQNYAKHADITLLLTDEEFEFI